MHCLMVDFALESHEVGENSINGSDVHCSFYKLAHFVMLLLSVCRILEDRVRKS
jgi:hypothetical protein